MRLESARGWRSWLRRHEWRLLAAGAFAAVGLGFWGFTELHSGSFCTRLYLAIQLFPLQSGAPSGVRSVPVALDIARFLAPLVASSAAVKAVLGVVREQVRSLELQRITGHTVVAGLGPDGLQVALSFVRAGEPVVAVDESPPAAAIDRCRAEGVTVVTGPPAQGETLRHARIQRARYFIAVGDDDSANLEAAEAAVALAPRRHDALQAFVRLSGLRLRQALSNRWFEPDEGKPSVDVFSAEDIAARLILEEHGPHIHGGPLVIVGAGALAEEIALHAAREWRRAGRAGHVRLGLALVDPRAGAVAETLSARHPVLDRLCVITAHECGFDSAEFEKLAFLPAGADRPTVILSAQDAREAVAAALALDQRARGARLDAVVCVPHGERSVRVALERAGCAIDAFGVSERVFTHTLVLRGTRELLARATHEDYVRRRAARGATVDGSPAARPWRDLPETYRRASREQVDSVRAKLAQLGCVVVPAALPEPGVEPIAFSPAEIEPLAEAEHERWLAERRRDGWSYGPVRDDERKKHPLLVPWCDLPEPEREKDRDTVRDLPARLELAGYRIVRGPEPAPLARAV